MAEKFGARQHLNAEVAQLKQSVGELESLRDRLAKVTRERDRLERELTDKRIDLSLRLSECVKQDVHEREMSKVTLPKEVVDTIRTLLLARKLALVSEEFSPREWRENQTAIAALNVAYPQGAS